MAPCAATLKTHSPNSVQFSKISRFEAVQKSRDCMLQHPLIRRQAIRNRSSYCCVAQAPLVSEPDVGTLFTPLQLISHSRYPLVADLLFVAHHHTTVPAPMPCARVCNQVSRGAFLRSPCRSQGRRVVSAQAQTADGPVLAIVGVTGAVGQEFLQVRPPTPTITLVVNTTLIL